jgi:hypothetical protein
VPAVSAYAQFFNTNEDNIWRRYEVNEKAQRSEFLNMERIRLTNSIIL